MDKIKFLLGPFIYTYLFTCVSDFWYEQSYLTLQIKFAYINKISTSK